MPNIDSGSLFEAVIGKLDRALRIIAGASLALVFLVIFIQVAMRYVLQSVPFFMEEAARYLCIWGVFSGMASAIVHGAHIRVGVLQPFLNRLTGNWFGLFLELICFCLYMIVVVYGFKLALFLHLERSIAMGIPLSAPAVAIPVFFTAASLVSSARIFQAANSTGSPFPRKRESSQTNYSL